MPDQDRLARVLAQYGLTAERVQMVTDNPKKPVWRIQAEGAEYYLKESHLSLGRLRYVLAAIHHLERRGVKSPPVVPTSGGAEYAEDDGRYFTLTRGIAGVRPTYEANLEAVVRSLARFHRASAGFQTPPNAEEHSHLGTWPDHYEKKLAELDQFAAEAENRPGAFTHLFQREMPFIRQQVTEALGRLRDGRYDNWVERVRRTGCLCHQDYAASNLRLVGRELFVYDMDGITQDLPARDLRKIINKVMKKGEWDPGVAQRLLTWYRSGNSLGRDEMTVLAADLQFPHLFCGVASKYFNDRAEDWTDVKLLAKLDQVCRVERQKARMVGQLIRP